ncbi:MAG: sigma-70 family RNA polymerase sigma factor [Bacilli bacterium]|jgi:RNA polymerase sporulation-specific sigma factor
MTVFEYNDYELIDLIREGNDDALEIMFKKYEPLIRSRISKFNIKPMMVEDFYQEGLLALNKAIYSYKMSSPKTFNKFFDLVLQRRFITLLRKNKHYFNNTVYLDDVNPTILAEPRDLNYEITSLEADDYHLTDLEKKVYFLKHKKGCKPRTIAMILGLDVKQVYNATDRIKAKIKNN